MIHNFKNDYTVGAHPAILQKLAETNLIQQLGYGEDAYTAQAKTMIKKRIANNDARVFFLSGGTQTNLITISFLLRVHEAVISAKTGHISANETGAIEATGHKVITVDSTDGKLRPNDIQVALHEYRLQPHVVKPRLVFISNSTEIGTHYTKNELQALSTCCKQHGLLLYLDGARLGHGLTAKGNDLSFADIAALTDVFYIGGTKNGALLGEALVFNQPELAHEFEFALKQKGAMLAKGRILAIQFLYLLENNHYLDLARHANNMASKLAQAFRAKGYDFLTNSVTNQIFPILPNQAIETLNNKYMFYVWKEIDDRHSVVRIMTSWATKREVVDEFVQDIADL